MNIPGGEVTLDQMCWSCKGTGMQPNTERTDRNQPREIACQFCHGAGYHLTDAGEELVSFIERHFDIRRKTQ